MICEYTGKQVKQDDPLVIYPPRRVVDRAASIVFERKSEQICGGRSVDPIVKEFRKRPARDRSLNSGSPPLALPVETSTILSTLLPVAFPV